MPRPNPGGISTNTGPSSPRPTPGFSANGDLNGGLLSQEVRGIRGAQVLTGAGDITPGYVLTATSSDELDWLPGGGGGGNGTDIGAIHPASHKRVVGGLVLGNTPGDFAHAPGTVLTATGYSGIRGAVANQEFGIWALGDGVLYEIGKIEGGSQIVGVVPLYDDNVTAVATGPAPVCIGADKIWTLTHVPDVAFDMRGSLTRINPDVGVADYFGNVKGQAVIDGRVSYTEFPGIDQNSIVFYNHLDDVVIVYCANAFVDKPGGVFYEVNPTTLAVTPYSFSNSDADSWPWNNLNSCLAFAFSVNDNYFYALADASTGFTNEKFLLRIDMSTKEILDVVGLGEMEIPSYSAKLECSNLFSGKLYWADSNGVLYRASTNPFADDGLSADAGFEFSSTYGGGYSGLWGTQFGGSYDQSIAVVVGYRSDGVPVLLDVNLFDMTIPGSADIVFEEPDSNGIPNFQTLVYVPYPESGWWIFDNSNGKAYRYFGGGYESPYPRFPYGGYAEWKYGPLVVTGPFTNNMRATWPDYSPVDNSFTNQLNVSFAGGEPAGSQANYATIIGGSDHSVYATGGTIIGGFGNTIYDGENSIILAGNGNNTGGENAIVGGRNSSAGGANALAVGHAAHANGASAQAFGGNGFNPSTASTDYSLVHGVGGNSFQATQYVHSANVESEGTVWSYSRIPIVGHVDGAVTVNLTDSAGAEINSAFSAKTCFIFRVHVMATRIFGQALGSAAWVRTVVAHIDAAGSNLVIDSVSSDVTTLNGQTWSLSITASGTLLRISVTGTAGHTLRVTGWVDHGFCFPFPNF